MSVPDAPVRVMTLSWVRRSVPLASPEAAARRSSDTVAG